MNKISKTLIIIGILLILSSVLLFVYYKYEDNIAGENAAKTLTLIKESINTSLENTSDDEMLTLNVNGHDYIGTILIPTLNLELPVMSYCDYERLKVSPCRYYGSINTDDLIICAHAYKTHFGNIQNLNSNDKIIFTDVTGKIYIYEVLEIEVLSPKDVSLMINNDFDLTLYTCTDDNMNRITVRCNKISEQL